VLIFSQNLYNAAGVTTSNIPTLVSRRLSSMSVTACGSD